MEREINISIKDKIAVADKSALYICGNSDFVINFAYDEEWEAHITKTARFIFNDSFIDVVFEGNQCAVPVISNTYNIQVGVFAGNLHTSTPAHISAKKSILCDSGSPAAPTDDVYSQIMDKLNSIGKGIAVSSSDGKAYTATIEGITKLDNDLEINIIPNVTSTTTSATLNVNGLGAKPIRVSSATSRGTYYPETADYLSEGRMVKLFYDKHANDGRGVWKAISFTRPIADNISGVVSFEHGGTGASTAAGARKSLGVPSLADFNALLARVAALEAGGGGNTITFYVDGTEYTAEARMTWEEWIESDYCERHECSECGETYKQFEIDGGQIAYIAETDLGECCGGYAGYVCGEDGELSSTDTIIADGHYNLS